METSLYLVSNVIRIYAISIFLDSFFGNLKCKTSLDKGTQRKTTENELPSLTQCTA